MIKRAALFFLGMDFITFFYYAVGNAQDFLVATQLMLLRAVSVLSVAALLCALTGLAAAVARRARGDKDRFPLALAGWIAALAAASALVFFSSSVRVFSAGL